MFRCIAMSVVCLGAVACLSAQPAAQPQLSIDVASIHPNTAGGGDSVRLREGGGRFSAVNQSTLMLLLTAFDIRRFQLVGGPGWLDSDRYDIEATTTGTGIITPEQYRPLLLSLLADRFHLRYHRESREMTGYSLVLAKGGPKLAVNQAPEGPEGLQTRRSAGKAVTIATKKPIDEFAKFLGTQLEGFVADDTGLKGRYDFTLAWSYDSDLAPDAPSLFSAIQEQLGLRLVSRKESVEMIAIDSIEKASEN